MHFDVLRGHEVVTGPPGSDSGAEAIICDPVQSVTAAMMQRMPRLRTIVVAGTGADAIAVEAATDLGISILNVGPVLAQATADLAFGLIISAARLAPTAEARLRAGRWEGWRFSETFGRDVHGATLGLVGYGSIGQAVACRARGFSMRVIHHTRHPTGQAGWIATLDDLLVASDIVSLHIPLNDETRHLIGRRRLDLLGPGGVLVNTARGAIVDEDALAEALWGNRLLAAGLDVYEEEPHIFRSSAQCPTYRSSPPHGKRHAGDPQRDASRSCRSGGVTFCCLPRNRPSA